MKFTESINYLKQPGRQDIQELPSRNEGFGSGQEDIKRLATSLTLDTIDGQEVAEGSVPFRLPASDFRLLSNTGTVAERLNEIFTPLHFEERIRLLYQYFSQREVLFTSSFGTRSAFLLHLVSQIQPSQPVHFIDTTFHFPETYAYKQKLAGQFGLHIIDIVPDATQNRVTAEEQWWKKDPGACCMINKVLPLEAVKDHHQVWISGLMAHQTDFRSQLRVFERKGDILKFHPLIDIDEGELLYYQSYYRLPRHPLEDKGYGSVGCEHCTVMGEGRSGRWKGLAKTECGLHP